MKYMMLINLGPKARDWRNLTEDERSCSGTDSRRSTRRPA